MSCNLTFLSFITKFKNINSCGPVLAILRFLVDYLFKNVYFLINNFQLYLENYIKLNCKKNSIAKSSKKQFELGEDSIITYNQISK